MILAVLLYNNSIHSTIKTIQFEVIHGPRTNPFDISPQLIIDQYTDKQRENLQVLHNQIKERIQNNKTKTIEKPKQLSNPEQVHTDQTVYIRAEPRKPRLS